MSIIEVARGHAERQDLALIIDHQVQLEAIKPAHRGLATSGTSIKDPMRVDAGVVADGKRGGVNEAHARTLTQLRMQIGAPVAPAPWASTRQSAHSSPRWETRDTGDVGHTRCNTRFQVR